MLQYYLLNIQSTHYKSARDTDLIMLHEVQLVVYEVFICTTCLHLLESVIVNRTENVFLSGYFITLNLIISMNV